MTFRACHPFRNGTVASRAGTWQGGVMDRKPARTAPIAGGALLALAIIVGTVVGASKGQPSIGFLGGLGIGIALMLIVALVDRARGGRS